MVGDIIAFYAIAIIAITSSVMVMESRKIFHAALYLALMFVSVGGIYILLTAEFIAAIQVLVYAGAVIVLVLFAIVLTGRTGKAEESTRKRFVLGTLVAFVFVLLLVQPLIKTPWPVRMIEFPDLNTYSVGFSLFTDYVIPFEIVSLALLAALIGAIYLSKREVPR